MARGPQSSAIRRLLLVIVTSAVLAGTVRAAEGAGPLSEARKLLESGKAQVAYELLSQKESEAAGDPEFDYLYGIAALESGHPSAATLALQRVLWVRPNHFGARLDLARAWYELGDYERAEPLFVEVLDANPPAAARETARRYLTALRTRREAQSTRLSGYVELGGGYDSNVNSSTDQSTVYVPIFDLDLDLAPGNVEASDTYATFGFGGQVDKPVSRRDRLIGRIDVSARRHRDEEDFDTTDFRASGTWQRALEDGLLRLGLSADHTLLDRQTYRETRGINAEWRRQLSRKNTLALFAQHQTVRYQDAAVRVNDIDQTLGGVTWLHQPDPVNRSLGFVGVYGGRENQRSQRADGDQRLVGLRAGGQVVLSDKTTLFGSLVRQHGDYYRYNVAFQTTREDKRTVGTVGLSRRLNANWGLTVRVSRTLNESNVPINDYARTNAAVKVRRTF